MIFLCTAEVFGEPDGFSKLNQVGMEESAHFTATLTCEGSKFI